MNEDRKQQLEQLLDKAMSSLEIQPHTVNINGLTTPVNIDGYRMCLQERWKSYSDYVLPILIQASPEILDQEAKLNLLDFIRQEFAPFTRDDRILTASSRLVSNPRGGFPLTRLLEQLLKIAIVRGTKKAVSAFVNSCEETHCTYQVIALLEGLELKEDTQPYKGIHLCSNAESEFVRYLTDDTSKGLPRGKTLLIIDCCTSPLFSKPTPPEASQEHPKKMGERWWEGIRFRLDVNTENPPKINDIDFNEMLFCHALSLACNSPIQICLKRRFFAEDELFNLSDARRLLTWNYGASMRSTEAGEAEIDKAKYLYEILGSLDSKVQERVLEIL